MIISTMRIVAESPQEWGRLNKKKKKIKARDACPWIELAVEATLSERGMLWLLLLLVGIVVETRESDGDGVGFGGVGVMVHPQIVYGLPNLA
jgi:hypothetical protein